MVFKSGGGDGRSGSFFFFTYDNRFLIKTASPGEKRLLTNLLDPLNKHIQNQQNNSLLARIYGLYTIQSNVFS